MAWICPVFRSVAVAVGFAFALAGCGGPPWTMHASSSSIALRWYPDTTPGALANQVAARHCAQTDKTAEMISDNRDGSAEYARFRCR